MECTISSEACVGLVCSKTLSKLLRLVFLTFSHSNGCVVVSHCGLTFISLMIKDFSVLIASLVFVC